MNIQSFYNFYSSLPAEKQLELSFSIMKEMSIVADEKLTSAAIPLYRYYSNELATGKSSWTKPEGFCSRFSPLFEAHIKQFSDSIPWSTSLKVVEMGAGYLTDGRSRLSHALPEAEITYTDLSLGVVNDALEKFPDSRYLHINSSNLTEKIDSSSIDVVAGSCFLDTLPEQELSEVLAQISSILKPGGTFFHILDLPPYFNTLVINHKDDQGIMFPCLNDEAFVRGIQFVPKEVCENFIQENPDSSLSIFLRDYIELTNDIRAATTIEICLLPLLAQALSQWVEATFAPVKETSPIRILLSMDDFKQRLENKIPESCFNIITSNSLLQSRLFRQEEVPDELEFNDILSAPNLFRQRKISRDDTNIRISLIAHILILKKKEG